MVIPSHPLSHSNNIAGIKIFDMKLSQWLKLPIIPDPDAWDKDGP
jgi:hypothetical protein